jgi:hypothetical protein
MRATTSGGGGSLLLSGRGGGHTWILPPWRVCGCLLVRRSGTDLANVCDSGTRLHEMAKFPKDAETVRKGMEHLWMVSVNAEKQKRIGSFKGGCKALITALQVRKHASSGCRAHKHARDINLHPVGFNVCMSAHVCLHLLMYLRAHVCKCACV